MKRRWHWEVEDPGIAAVVLWGFWWIVGLIASALSTIPDHGNLDSHSPWWSWLTFSIWGLGAVVVPILGVSAWGCRWLWQHRPRRVWEPVRDDLRKGRA